MKRTKKNSLTYEYPMAYWEDKTCKLKIALKIATNKVAKAQIWSRMTAFKSEVISKIVPLGDTCLRVMNVTLLTSSV